MLTFINKRQNLKFIYETKANDKAKEVIQTRDRSLEINRAIAIAIAAYWPISPWREVVRPLGGSIGLQRERAAAPMLSS